MEWAFSFEQIQMHVLHCTEFCCWGWQSGFICITKIACALSRFTMQQFLILAIMYHSEAIDQKVLCKMVLWLENSHNWHGLGLSWPAGFMWGGGGGGGGGDMRWPVSASGMSSVFPSVWCLGGRNHLRIEFLLVRWDALTLYWHGNLCVVRHTAVFHTLIYISMWSESPL
jgi:hypothetical protein